MSYNTNNIYFNNREMKIFRALRPNISSSSINQLVKCAFFILELRLQL